MPHEMRRTDRKLDRSETLEILEKGEYGILNTIGTDGYPYGVPVNYVYQDDAIYFHCASQVGHKLENIKANPKVSFTVVGKTQVLPDKFATKYESAIAFGEAAEVIEEKYKALEYFIDKFSPEFKEAGKNYIHGSFDKVAIYKIEIKNLTGKARKV